MLRSRVDLVAAYIVLLQKRLIAVPQEPLPKIQIKGIAADLAKFRKDVQLMRESMPDLHDARSGLHQDIKDVTEQFNSLRQDVRFELEQLGNGGGGSDDKSEKQVITAKDVGDIAPLVADPTASVGSEH